MGWCRHNRDVGAGPTGAAAASNVCTIVTRSSASRAETLERALGLDVEALTLDDPGGKPLAALLGERWERFAAGFDRHELRLALLPLLLTRSLDASPSGVAYIAADAEVSQATVSVPTAAIGIDPLLPPDAGDEDRLDALALPPDAAVRELLHRWSDLAAGVLEQDDRTLTVRTTLRWLRALADVLPGISITPAGIARPGPAGPAGPGGRAGPAGPAGPEPVLEPEPDYAFDALPGGLPLTLALRRLLRRAGREAIFCKPFSEPDLTQLMSWLSEPVDSAAGVPRYLAALRDRRSDLRERWPEWTPEAGRALLEWAHEHGRSEDPVLNVLLSPSGGSRSASWLPRPPLPNAPFGVNVLGYWNGELGIGEAARLVAVALDAAQVPLLPIDAPSERSACRHRHPFVSAGANWHPFPVNLVCVNPDGVDVLRRDAGDEPFASRPTIGYWWWEVVGSFPQSWQPAFEVVDEVWVGSSHVRDAVEPDSPVPVTLVPIPVLPLPRAGARSELGLPDGFLFITVFDYESAFERKNPLAVVRAFRDAFEPGSGAALLVKSINASHQPDNRDELAILASGHPDIHIEDGHRSATELDALLAQADCMVSLHRAEGFGLPLARALRSGIPVVATAYGGNLDFTTDENSYLVEHRPATVPAGTIYPAGAHWVEPELDHAVRQLKAVFEDPAQAGERARSGAQALQRNYSPAATGARMAAELRRIHNRLPRPFSPTPHTPAVEPTAIIALREMIAQARGAPAGPGQSKPDQLVRRVREAIVGESMEERTAIDQRLVEAVARLAEGEAGHAQALDRLEERLAQLEAGAAPAGALAQTLSVLRRLER